MNFGVNLLWIAQHILRTELQDRAHPFADKGEAGAAVFTLHVLVHHAGQTAGERLQLHEFFGANLSQAAQAKEIPRKEKPNQQQKDSDEARLPQEFFYSQFMVNEHVLVGERKLDQQRKRRQFFEVKQPLAAMHVRRRCEGTQRLAGGELHLQKIGGVQHSIEFIFPRMTAHPNLTVHSQQRRSPVTF